MTECAEWILGQLVVVVGAAQAVVLAHLLLGRPTSKMFTGIKSILFGTSDQQPASSSQLDATSAAKQSPDQPSTSTSNASNHRDPADPSLHGAAGATKPSKLILSAIQEKTGFSRNDTSALIEQTLSAAASLVTEQLSPQSPSIEQLQSNSRQLLPALGDQPQGPAGSLSSANQEPIDKPTDDADDENDEDDTWELLDLVDASTNHADLLSSSSWSQVPSNSSSVDTSASAQKKAKKSRDQRLRGCHKLEVTFKTPDLVTVEPAETVSAQEEIHKHGASFVTSKAENTQPGEHGQVVMELGKPAPKQQNITTSISENQDHLLDCEELQSDEENPSEYFSVIPDEDADGEDDEARAYEEEEVEEAEENDDVDGDKQNEEIEEVIFGHDQLNEISSEEQTISITTKKTTAKKTILSNLSCGNDSQSDLTEMDESWYVTPPPCFTGSNYHNLNKFKSPKATKEAARENALIEHPSIYISSNPKQQLEHKNLNNDDSDDLDQINKSMIAPIEDEEDHQASDDSDELAHSSHEEAEVMLQLIDEEDLENIDEQDAEDDEVADVSEIDTDDEDAENGAPLGSQTTVEDQGLAAFVEGFDHNYQVEASEVEEKALDNPKHQGSTDVVTSSLLDMWSAERKAKPGVVRSDGQRPASRSLSNQTDCSVGSTRKTLVQVRPLEPERQPGWQLRKKRSKRRPLSAIAIQGTSNGQHKRSVTKSNSLTGRQRSPIPRESESRNTVGPGSSSAANRDSPAFINRIGSTIVANLNNLTNGLPIHSRVNLEEAEKLSHTLVRKTAEVNQNQAQRRLSSKSYLDRQNACAKVANTNRRADRRLKIYTTPNGCSVNRKVHTNFH